MVWVVRWSTMRAIRMSGRSGCVWWGAWNRPQCRVFQKRAAVSSRPARPFRRKCPCRPRSRWPTRWQEWKRRFFRSSPRRTHFTTGRPGLIQLVEDNIHSRTCSARSTTTPPVHFYIVCGSSTTTANWRARFRFGQKRYNQKQYRTLDASFCWATKVLFLICQLINLASITSTHDHSE